MALYLRYNYLLAIFEPLIYASLIKNRIVFALVVARPLIRICCDQKFKILKFDIRKLHCSFVNLLPVAFGLNNISSGLSKPYPLVVANVLHL